MYKWPDEDEWREGIIIHTNYKNYEDVLKICNISDDDVLIYTDTLDSEKIKESFDGLEIQIY